jgi:hypothetical protein
MAKRRKRDPAKVVKSISAQLRRLGAKRYDKTTGKFSKSEERAVQAAIKRLDRQLKELGGAIHTWGWYGKRK